jgi:hypothetical protein
MKREVLTSKDVKVANESGRVTRGPADVTVPVVKDEYFDRLLKYIPGEVVACYLLVAELMGKLAGKEQQIIHWLVFAIFCLLTYLYLWKKLHVTKVQQLIISVFAFVVWVFALGGPFALYGWYDALYGAILLPVYTLTVAIFEAE